MDLPSVQEMKQQYEEQQKQKNQGNNFQND